MFGNDVRIDEIADGAVVAVVPTAGAPIPVAVTDTGEGASQVLAVLVLGAMADSGRLGQSPLLVLEQPRCSCIPPRNWNLVRL